MVVLILVRVTIFTLSLFFTLRSSLWVIIDTDNSCSLYNLQPHCHFEWQLSCWISTHQIGTTWDVFVGRLMTVLYLTFWSGIWTATRVSKATGFGNYLSDNRCDLCRDLWDFEWCSSSLRERASDCESRWAQYGIDLPGSLHIIMNKIPVILGRYPLLGFFAA